MNRLTGILLVICSAAAFATLPIIGRYAYAAGLDVTTLLFLRFGCSALILWGWLAVRRAPLPRAGELLLLAAMGGLGYAGQSFCYLSASRYASVGLVALLLYLYPAFVTVLTLIVFRARLTRTRLVVLVLATTGAALTANPQGGQLPGILLAIAAAAIYAVYILVGARVLKTVSPIQSSAVIFASAAVVLGGLAALGGPHWPSSPAGWQAVAAVALAATVLPVIAFLAGIQRIGPSDAAMLSTLEPVVTVLLAMLLFGEAPQLRTLFGGALILAAVLLLTLERPPAQAAT